MSATGRNLAGNERQATDFYATPPWLVRAILPCLRVTPHRILEPAAGDGAIVRELRAAYPSARIDEYELTRGADFLAKEPRPEYDLVITNPPYALAERFVRHALRFRRSHESEVVMLLRLNFLGGQKRAAWLRACTPCVFVSPRRPSFTGRGTDATEYAWFIWGARASMVTILPTEMS